MSTLREYSRDSKRIDLRPRKRKILDANFSAIEPSVLQLNIEGLSASKVCVIEQLENRYKAFLIILGTVLYNLVLGEILGLGTHLFVKVPQPGDREMIYLHTNPFKCWTSSREAVNTNF